MNSERREILSRLLEFLIKDENPDSLEIGTPAKGGAIKVYGNFEKPEEFKLKFDNAFSLRDYARNKMVSE